MSHFEISPEYRPEDFDAVILALRSADGENTRADGSDTPQTGKIMPLPELSAEETALLETHLRTLGVQGEASRIALLPHPLFPSCLLICVGVGASPTGEDLRNAAGEAIRRARGKNRVAVIFPALSEKDLKAVTEGLMLGKYLYTRYTGEEEDGGQKIHIVSALAGAKDILDETVPAANAVNTVRDLTNTPAADLNPDTFAQIALDEARDAGCTVTVYEGEALIRERLAGLLAVGSGSQYAPRLIRVQWSAENAKKNIALVGKGITFDTGGYCLKPGGHMTTMKTDMCGAATALYTVLTAARLRLAVKVCAWLCIAENMVSATASRPDDVITYRNGTSVEINNTDAEGRLVMADGLLMAAEEKPDAIIDIATLTGAQTVALGERVSAVMGTESVRADLCRAAEETDELLWPMPLPAHLKTGLESDIADLKNSGPRSGGMLVAGVFLREFTGGLPWAHIDIAGPAFNREKPYGCTPKGATGVMLRTLLRYLETAAR